MLFYRQYFYAAVGVGLTVQFIFYQIYYSGNIRTIYRRINNIFFNAFEFFRYVISLSPIVCDLLRLVDYFANEHQQLLNSDCFEGLGHKREQQNSCLCYDGELYYLPEEEVVTMAVYCIN